LRRRPWLSTFAAVAGLVLALLAAQLARERDSARRQAERAQQAAARAQSALDFLTDLLGQAQPAMHRGTVPTVSDLLDRGAKRLVEGQEPPVLRAELLNALGRIHIERGEFAQAARALEAARALFPLAEVDPATRAEAAGNLAYALDYRESSRAFALLDEADGLLARDDTRVAMRLRFHRYRCGVLHGTGQIDAAEKCLRALINEATLRVGAHHAETAGARLWWAMALDDLDRRDEAVAAAASGYEDLRLALGDTHPRVIDAGGIYVSRLHNSGRHAEEEARLRELIPQVEKLWGEQHPKVARYLTWQGSAISAQGRPTEAIAILERALAIYDAAPAHDDLGSPNTLSALGEAHARLNQPDRALGYFARMRARQDERPSAVPPDDGWRSLPPIIVARESGRLDIAAHWLRDARARADTATPSPIHAQLDFQSALYYEARQQRALAVACIDRAIRMTRKARDPEMIRALEHLAPEAVAEDARTVPACPTP
jgi:tetratricopeptide (TPR) repeat protein